MPLLPFAGIPTFARAPHAPLGGAWRADAAVLGIPFDAAVGFRPGQRFAPRAVREASLRYTLPPEGFYDLRADRVRLAGLSLVDAGDVDLPSLEPDLARARIVEDARALRARATLPIFLGGDHSVTASTLRAFDDVPALHVVQLDAHLDFTDVRNGTRWSNSSPFRRAAEFMPNLERVTTLGLRGLRFDREAVDAARARGHVLVPMWELEGEAAVAAALERLPRGERVYLSFDVDVLDPSILPGTSSPEPDGMTAALARRIVAAAAERNTVVGADLVELAPGLDASGNSALLAARVVMDVIGAVFG